MPTKRATKLLVIGWDAADWAMIDPLIAAGKMPNLKRLIDAGTRADLATLEPKLSPILWTSIATGKWGDKHGILNFVEANPAGDGLRVSASTTRKTKALWNIATQSDLRTHAIGWYASHPAEPISGVCVTNLVQDGVVEGSVHPDDWRTRLQGCRVAPEDTSPSDLAKFIPNLKQVRPKDERPKKLATQLARMRTIHSAACEVLRGNQDWQCAMVFYETIDTIGHHFMEYLPPKMPHVTAEEVKLFGEVMPRTYEAHDRALGELLELAGPGTTVLLLSDHGFHSGAERPVIKDIDPLDRAALEASWHRSLGVIVLSGPGVKSQATLHAPTLLDIAPTALALLGVPTGDDMDGRVISEAFDSPYESATIPSWDAVVGSDGMHPAEKRAAPFESADALKQLIDLGYMPALSGNAQAQLALARRESQANLAVIYMFSGRPLLAIPLLESLHADHPDETRFITNLANCLLAQRDFTRCAALLDPFVAKHPESIESAMQLAAALAQGGDRDRARQLVDMTLGRTRPKPELAFALGGLRLMLHQFSEAAQQYQESARHDSKDPRPHVGLARVALHERRWEEAAEHCMDAAERRHITPEAHDLLGVALAWLNDLPHAIQSFEFAVAMQPGLIDAHRFLAVVAEQSGDQAKAAHHHARAEELKSRATTPAPPPTSFGAEAWAAHMTQSGR